MAADGPNTTNLILAGGALAALALVRARVQKSAQKPKIHPAQDMDQFRKNGHELVEWIANYRETCHELPVLSSVSPGYLKDALSTEVPDEPEPFSAVMSDLNQHIVPGLTHWESSKFFAYFKGHSSNASALGEFLIAGLNVMGFSWIASPACTELETIVMDWLAKLMNLPPCFLSTSVTPTCGGVGALASTDSSPLSAVAGGGGVIQGSAGESAIVALIAARERALHVYGGGSAEGAEGAEAADAEAAREAASARLVVYMSDQTHTIIQKACRVLNIRHMRKIEARAENGFAMDAADLQAAIDADIEAGLLPVFVVGTAGTTSSTALDPLRAIGEVCRALNIWFHVDAAYGGAYAVCPEFQHIFDGVEHADSLAVNAHKKLLTSFDCCMMWVKDRRFLVSALTLSPAYLRNKATDSGAVIDYKNWQLPLGRRFRALKLWMVLRAYGKSGLRAHIRTGVRLAELLEGWIADDPLFELFCPRTMALVCFRLADAEDSLNQALKEAVNATGDAFLITTRMAGQTVLRVAIGGINITEEHMEHVWAVLQEQAKLLLLQQQEEAVASQS